MCVKSIHAMITGAKEPCSVVGGIQLYTHTECDSLSDIIGYPRSKIVELESDAARLDWLDKHYGCVEWLVPNADDPFCEVGATNEGIRNDSLPYGNGGSIREAIDDAIINYRPNDEPT